MTIVVLESKAANGKMPRWGIVRMCLTYHATLSGSHLTYHGFENLRDVSGKQRAINKGRHAELDSASSTTVMAVVVISNCHPRVSLSGISKTLFSVVVIKSGVILSRFCLGSTPLIAGPDVNPM